MWVLLGASYTQWSSFMKKIPWWHVELGSEAAEAPAQTIRDRNLSMAGVVETLERRIAKILDVPHVIAVANGTTALMLALLEAGIGHGDEVIVPDRTWIATAHAAHLLGAKVVLVDIDPDRYLIDPDAIEMAITSKTKAILPVHLNGCACDMPRIRDIAEQHGIHVIEDAAQAFYSRSPEGGFLGTHSRMGCFSLSIAKLITSVQGGFIVTHDAEIDRRLRLMRVHGTKSITDAHWNFAGGNFRLIDILASIALTQLDHLEQKVSAVTSLYQKYMHSLKGIDTIRMLPVHIENGEIPLYIEVLLEHRTPCLEWLSSHSVEPRPACPALHTAPYFISPDKSVYKNSIYFAEHAMTLPSGPDQDSKDIDIVLDLLRQWVAIITK